MSPPLPARLSAHPAPRTPAVPLRRALVPARAWPRKTAVPTAGRTFEVGGAIGRVFVERRLSAGVEASVYAVRRPGRGPLALKVFDLAHTSRAEVSAAYAWQRRCAGPWVVAGHALHIEGRRAYVLMERAAGPSVEDDLAHTLASGRLIPLRLTLQRFALMAQAAAHCHSRGTVHRDLKPANFVLTKPHGAQLKLIDFAAAAQAHVPHTSGAGTTLYLAPEALRGAPTHEAQDVWALGITLFCMITGIEPHYADDEALAAAQVLAAAPSFTAADLALYIRAHTERAVVIEGLVALYQAATAQDPRARPSAQQLARIAARLVLSI